ncbi:MAG: tRNA threonylcarbamoyladenosine dehydratase [Cellulosilyticaceae bacterium]
MEHKFSRTELLIGTEGLDKLINSTVMVYGVGGVGSFVVEALARSGVGKLILIDADTVAISNINRQLPATMESVGRPKVEVMKERVEKINDECEVIALNKLYLPETREEFFAYDADYIVDAIDMVTAKIDLIVEAKKRNIPIMSSMGAGNKLDPTRFEITDIYKTSVCPLAKVLRKELKVRGVKKLKVVYSKEQPLTPIQPQKVEQSSAQAQPAGILSKRRQTPGSVAFVPSVAGLIIASEVVKDLMA